VTTVGATWRVGADIGGTFTDIVALAPDARLLRLKVPSTPLDYSKAIADALAASMTESERAAVWSFVHGTTVATNAILQETEQPIALITSAGFRDVLDMRRARRPTLYDLSWTPPKPLVPGWLRFEVDERIGADGTVVTALDQASVDRCVNELQDLDVAAIAVCLLNSHRNPAHEDAITAHLRAELPAVPVTASASIAPEPKEYERTSTTVVNAFLLPVIEQYLTRLVTSLDHIGITAPLQIMQSDGTNAGAEIVRHRPFLIIESGPAAGVVAAARLAAEMERPSVITFDMGGTTAKAGLVENYRARFGEELEVGDAHNRAGGLMRGAGLPVLSPCIDLSEVGSGGGSVAWIDGGGVLRVGPRSAGSEPGPACYGQGGIEPTVTDAHVALGYVSPVAIAGGTKALFPERARTALATLAGPLDLSVEDVAYGIFSVATATMRRAVRAVSVERGRDPRDFSLFAFGGAGGLHGAALADELDMNEVVVPMVPGLFSSLGLLFSDLAITRVSSIRAVVDETTVATMQAVIEERKIEVLDELLRSYAGTGDPRVEITVNLRYLGQASTLPVAVSPGLADPQALLDAFHQEHHLEFGQSAPGDPVEMVAVRVRAGLPAPALSFEEIGRQYVDDLSGAEVTGPRPCYFGPTHGWMRADVIGRQHLRSRERSGPLVIEEPEATVLVPPSFTAVLDPTGSIVLSRDQ
jgi:N-methylhydantoinase A